MAGTAQTYELNDVSNRYGPGLLVDIADDLRAVVDDLEVLRAGLSDAEDWILEVNTDLETIIRGSASNTTIASLVDAAGETHDVTVTGAALGDLPLASLNLDLQDMLYVPYVDAADSGQIRLQNESTATVDLADTNEIVFLAIPDTVSALTGTVTAGVLSATAFDAAGDMTAYDITIS